MSRTRLLGLARLLVLICAIVASTVAIADRGSTVTHARAAASVQSPAPDARPASAPNPVHAPEPADAATPAGAPAVLRASRAAAVSPGSLPQTEAFPSAADSHFRSLMKSLWHGVQRDSVGVALRAFFPLGAYEQLKAIAGAESDWRYRLVHDYALDIYNRDGYFELPNARVVYREGGAVRSFGIASMISWRGVWYVVHFGSVLRPEDVGEVDEPSSGAGISQYSGTC